ncbi:MAG: protein kinase [Acaryochloridaceae cyanobacterium RL_2_7]|nr:protein kinase [Acaryochloridaceae cyanobacterium RL_2_7]
MTSQASGDLQCSQGHRNPNGNLYCQYCGEKLTAPDPSKPTMIGDRYRVIKEIGRGGFGHTYLAEDTNRFNETCVLKEFAPELNHQDSLGKAKELFSREAEVLYRLEHSQIPKFREWFMDEKVHSLFLAQDYVVGPTYFALLQQRKAQGLAFTEGEVLEFLRESLPILSYIHEQGVIHRDISPDNLICRESDKRPILIDFGGVKQVTITVGQWQAPKSDAKKNITLIGKPAYAPEEQIRLGQVNPSSDIYSLGVTALCLLMGKEPQEFFDSFDNRFKWRNSLQIQPHFAAILEKMTAPRANDRYRSAQQVLSDLPDPPSTGGSAGGTPPKTPQTILVSPAQSGLQTATKPNPTPPVVSQPVSLPNHTVAVNPEPQPRHRSEPGLLRRLGQSLTQAVMSLIKTVLVLSGILGLGALGWWAIQTRLVSLPNGSNPPEGSPSETTAQVSPEEQERRQFILNRVATLKIPDGYFNRVTNEAYFLQYPEQQGRLLNGSNPEDEMLRAKWYDVAQQIINFSDQLSDRTRSRLGRLGQRDLDRITTQLEEDGINREQFLRQVERDLLNALPMYRNQNLGQQQVNQLRLALASERALSR